MSTNNNATAVRGERHGSAKLTEEIVEHCRFMHERRGVAIRELARRHGVAFSTMFSAVRRETWGHLP